MIKWLQNWYYQLCDGEWEHQNRIRIETIDNPGWSIEIDISKCGSDILPKSWTCKCPKKSNSLKLDINV